MKPCETRRLLDFEKIKKHLSESIKQFNNGNVIVTTIDKDGNIVKKSKAAKITKK